MAPGAGWRRCGIAAPARHRCVPVRRCASAAGSRHPEGAATRHRVLPACRKPARRACAAAPPHGASHLAKTRPTPPPAATSARPDPADAAASLPAFLAPAAAAGRPPARSVAVLPGAVRWPRAPTRPSAQATGRHSPPPAAPSRLELAHRPPAADRPVRPLPERSPTGRRARGSYPHDRLRRDPRAAGPPPVPPPPPTREPARGWWCAGPAPSRRDGRSGRRAR